MSEATKHIQSQIDVILSEAVQSIQSEYEADTPEAKKAASGNYDKAMAKVTKLETLLDHTKNEEAQPSPQMTVDTLEMQMREAADAGEMSTYQSLREQRTDLIKRYGKHASVTSSKAFKTDYPTPNGKYPDLIIKMQAAADAGDIKLYRELRARRQKTMAG